MVLAQDLRNAVLQAAMQGKLTKQYLPDSAFQEKEQDVSFFDEVPFDIPKNWKWVKVKDVCSNFLYGTPRKSQAFGGMPVLRMGNISHGEITYDELVYTSDVDDIKKYALHKGDLLFNRTNSREKVGQVAIYRGDMPAIYAGYLVRFTPDGVNGEYMHLIMQSSYYKKYCASVRLDAIGQSNINAQKLKDFLFPLPHIEEQQRIVERVNAIMEQIDEYEKIEQKLVALKADFPGNIKAAILQAAMQGKLTEQLDTDGSVEELLEAIKQERNSLSKKKEYKIDMKTHPIDDSSIPFDIPDNWQFVSLRDIVYNRQLKVPKEKFSYIDIGSIDNFHQKLNQNENILNADEAPSRARKIVKYGDVLYSTVRPYLHNMCIVDREFSFEPIASTGFAAMVCFTGILNKYLLYYLLSPQFDKYANATDIARGVAYPAISDKRLYNAIVPLPPTKEQHRIVERLDALLPLCENL